MKRLYIKKAAYFITTNPQFRLAFFSEDLISEIFAYNLFECAALKDAFLIGYKINPDHVHILVQVGSQYNISEVVHSIKRITTIKINQILSFKNCGETHRVFQWTPSQINFRNKFLQKYGSENHHDFPLFKWQAGFNDQLIRSKLGLNIRIAYLKKQQERHSLNDNKWLYISPTIPNDIIFVGE